MLSCYVISVSLHMLVAKTGLGESSPTVQIVEKLSIVNGRIGKNRAKTENLPTCHPKRPLVEIGWGERENT